MIWIPYTWESLGPFNLKKESEDQRWGQVKYFKESKGIKYLNAAHHLQKGLHINTTVASNFLQEINKSRGTACNGPLKTQLSGSTHVDKS